MQRSLLSLLVLIVLTSCQRGSKPTQVSREDQLIQQLVEGGPREKISAAKELQRLRSKRAVPYLLAEARHRYPKISYEPVENPKQSHEMNAYVIEDGKRVPYVDYHAPLFSALSEIAVPYFEPDKAWFEAIDDWIRENLPEQDSALKP